MLSVTPSRLKDNQMIPQTGMAILDVGMLSGFTLSPGAVAPTALIPKIETLPDKVIFYLVSVSFSFFSVRCVYANAIKAQQHTIKTVIFSLTKQKYV